MEKIVALLFVLVMLFAVCGCIGGLELNGDSYVEKFGKGELVSLNKRYKPIRIGEYESFRVFGRVVG